MDNKKIAVTTADDFSPDALNRVMTVWKERKAEHRKALEEERKELAKIYGHHVKVERCRRVLSQEDLAKLAGRSLSFIAKVECGSELPSKTLHKALMKVFLSKPEADPSKFRVRGIHQDK
jgi:ribosome-binding protein aMBF1 (putative translation factor)